jgi:hypothetical protein
MSSTRLGATLGSMNTRALTTRLAALGVAVAVAAVLLVGWATGRDSGTEPPFRGITYDTGSMYGTELEPLSRQAWSNELMEGEIEAIADELHANSVSVFGADVDRLVATAQAALERDLHVWIQPRMEAGTRAEILTRLARTARAAERLREEHAHVGLNVGVESTLFVPGIVPGGSALERIELFAERYRSGQLDLPALQGRLNAYLEQVVDVARRNFDGEITYSAGPWEAEGVDWSKFDYVGLDYYTFHAQRAGHLRELSQFRRFGKPILITEFGTNAFEGAPKLEGDGWNIIDYTKTPPQISGNRVRDEQVQADYLVEMLEIFDSLELEGAYVYTFISPDAPHTPDPRYDQDLASFSVTKTILDDPEDPASPYRWEPKQGFHALADYYGSDGD